MIESKLDTDSYKLTMQQGVCTLYPRAQAKFRFINRDNTQFPVGFGDHIRGHVEQMEDLHLAIEEEAFLRGLPYLTPVYVDFFRGFKFNPDEVKITQNGGCLKIDIEGPWYSSMMWETPLMAIISECYFKLMGLTAEPDDVLNRRDAAKAELFKMAAALFAEFGSRRRFSFDNQLRNVDTMVATAPDCFVGTSNMHIAHMRGLKPIGTQAHEWFMFHAAKYGPRTANAMALERWVDVYRGELGIALPDTFTCDNFLLAFNMMYAKLFDGVRHDSGDPFVFANKMIDHYRKLGIDPMSKTIIFSDGLNPDAVVKLAAHCRNRIKCAFGIGTNLSNDVGVKPLNMVIKMVAARPHGMDWIPTVKLSDTVGKHTGDPTEVELYQRLLRV
jgi:nicotinate phosphoribosyltransferase